MFAVIRTGGKQYKISKNDTLRVEKLEGEAGDSVTLDIIMMGDDKGAKIGSALKGASVTAEIVDQIKGEKVIIFKKRRRHNSKRKRGHRQDLMIVRISEILTGGAQPSKAAN